MAKTIDQISVFLNNKPGVLNEFLKNLEKEQINLHSLNISETDKYGVARIIVDNAHKVFEYLKSQKYLLSITPVFVVSVNHSYGALKELVEIISSETINIEYMYSMAYLKKENEAYMPIVE